MTRKSPPNANRPGLKVRSIAAPDALWLRLRAEAERLGLSISVLACSYIEGSLPGGESQGAAPRPQVRDQGAKQVPQPDHSATRATDAPIHLGPVRQAPGARLKGKR